MVCSKELAKENAHLRAKIASLEEINEFLFDENKRLEERVTFCEQLVRKYDCLTCLLHNWFEKK